MHLHAYIVITPNFFLKYFLFVLLSCSVCISSVISLLNKTAVEKRGTEKGDEYLFNMDLFMIDAVEHRLQSAGLRRKRPSSNTPSVKQEEREGGGSAELSSTTSSEEVLRNTVMDEVEGSGYLIGIDAKWWGNVGRFFNHSCHPNMDKQAAFTTNQDLRVPSVAYFTNNDVPAGTELT